ncbi:GWT1-domain-containing protein [Suillus discolor]|uniref:GPI-anchored wall transfer protein 1 n=1 Tax=Suillus discolor TaxID=1912936 RepID=A0A9P7K087_9AGAM|nr:GWT1-domain-containing protein [Suillus discolor]KAG2119494.1 GWT1-domain-containing protein [Suillus discolor]
MDIGVGSFVFSQGVPVVSAIPIIKDISCLQAPILPKLKSVSRKTILIIGLSIGFVSHPLLNSYNQEHVTEYGVHWNFFLTLALLPMIIEVLFHPIISRIPLLCWVFGLEFVVHQLALSSGRMKDFLLNTSRSNIIIFANKEGLLSLPGCVSIHILGLSSGTVILPPFPSFSRKQQWQSLDGPSSHQPSRLDPSALRQTAKIITELLSYSVVWWMLLAFVRLGFEGWFILLVWLYANISYVLWVAVYNTSFILGYILLDMVFSPTSTLKIRDQTDPSGERLEKGPKSSVPALLEVINRNRLFLLSNVATGLINLNIQTMSWVT